jgi:ElaB/YqjD/DUF883 family membrane-anchored ribosome-binding protein
MSRDPKSFDEARFEKNQSANAEFKEIKDKVSDIASKTREKAGQMADAVSEKLDEQRENAAEGLGRVASTLHEKADNVPGGQRAVNFTHSIADSMESTATYLREHDFSGMGKDLMSVCRKYPTQSIVAALAVGFLIGRSARR